jgi:hypothetical protein
MPIPRAGNHARCGSCGRDFPTKWFTPFRPFQNTWLSTVNRGSIGAIRGVFPHDVMLPHAGGDRDLGREAHLGRMFGRESGPPFALADSFQSQATEAPAAGKTAKPWCTGPWAKATVPGDTLASTRARLPDRAKSRPFPPPCNCFPRFLIGRTATLRLALVPELFALGQSQLELDLAIFEVHPGRDQSETALPGLAY